ncbi:HAMP domain-containing protein [Paenibacillus sp. MWE-103]|uniref:histidine kinase n=1 Tax=Paenibacillus artemisiicola TaxID=1172618 RepID=A0ABS3WGJ8_9BACL|nr:HAMP domain-containing sensor histidine kinase [Paenibacillus artemisiicola]MBO7747413.1 HAMP domain-containing protein [Paenibacillus artemisiicola]
MRLRVYLLLANAVSLLLIVVILVCLYQYMLLSERQLIWLTLASLGAGLLSALLHFLLVRPVEAAVRQVGEGSARIADGDLGARVPLVGPAELKTLAGQFNEMGGRLEASFRQLQAAEAARRELVANLAHDLRTPLASLQAYAEALEDDIVPDEPTKRRYMATIRGESIRLGTLIRQLFEISTLDAAKRPLPESLADMARTDSVPCVLEDVLVELLPRFAPSLDARGLRLRVSLPDVPLVCGLASESLARILQNLLENAVRHSPAGGLIRIAGEPADGGMVRVSVADEGAGVREADRERIFERFYRADRARGRDGGGAGLGLAIAKSLAEQAGGRIGVQRGDAAAPEAGAGPGSAFWFTVPAGRGDPAGGARADARKARTEIAGTNV